MEGAKPVTFKMFLRSNPKWCLSSVPNEIIKGPLHLQDAAHRIMFVFLPKVPTSGCVDM